jgi:hypothetical protein
VVAEHCAPGGYAPGGRAAGLLVGYANLGDAAIARGIALLGTAVRSASE